MANLDLEHASVRDLLATYSEVMNRLLKLKVVQTSNNPVADYCEALVVRALTLTPTPRSTKGCDAIDDKDSKRYEIKGRRITTHNPSTQLSVIRGLDLCHFDFLVAVLFDENFGVTCAYRIPHEVLLTVDHARREHVNGWVFHLTKSLWDLPGVSDITQKVQDAQAKWA